MKKFEVPYNFDFNIIEYYSSKIENISFIYMPAYRKDSKNARSAYENYISGKESYVPFYKTEYIEHLTAIAKAKLKVLILWQENENLINENQIECYLKHGASGFVFTNDLNAKKCKKIDRNIITVASIIKKLTYHKILYADLSDYDFIVPFYSLCRSLDVLKRLTSIKEKIVLMPNTRCHANCEATHHWFASKDTVNKIECGIDKNLNSSCFIYPEHLYLFEDHVAGYKLQGREWNTDFIKKNCESYFNRKTLPHLIDERKDTIFKNMIKNNGQYHYYNAFSDIN